MIILPARSAASGPPLDRATSLLREQLTNRQTCLFVVFDDGNDARECASRADVRAAAFPSSRVVVWMPDPGAVDPGLCTGWRLGNELSVALTFDGRIAKRLSLPEAHNFFEIEQAFLAAQAGVGA